MFGYVQSAKKERTYEPNNKFDKTYKIFFKVLSQYDIRSNSLLTYCFTNKSFQ
jgi:hypothetical protein